MEVILQMSLVMNNTLTLTQIYPTVEDFLEDYSNNGIPTTITQESCTTLYYLLQSQYGSWQIASNSSKIFATKLFATIFKFGPTWEKKLELQSKIRNLTDEELLQGSKAIYNRALNPGIAPSTSSLEELTSISEQNTTNYKRSKAEAYQVVWDMLAEDVTSAFIDQFKPLFSKFILDSNSIYIDEGEEDE